MSWYKFHGAGKTAWETSYFGGVKRVLSEYPFYSLNYDLFTHIDPDSKTGEDLTVYQRDKLVNILLNEMFKRVEEKADFLEKMHDEAMKTLRDEELFTKRLVHFYGRQKLAIPISTGLLHRWVKLSESTELKSLFKEYGEDIYSPKSSVVVHIDIPSKNNSDDTGSAEAKEAKDRTNIIEQFERFANSYKEKDSLEDFRVVVEEVSKTDEILINSEEVVFAKKLFNMLDIVQDPKADIIKNLLQGAIDDEKIAEVLAGNNRIHMRRVEDESVKPFKVVVLGDYSGSMNYGKKFDFQKKVMKSLFYLFHDLLKIEDVEFYGHSGEHTPTLYKFHSSDYPHFMKTFNTYINLRENYDGPVIEHLHKMVRSKSDKAVLLISLSDGQPSGNNYGGGSATKKMKQIMEKIKRDNFITVGIGMLYTHTEGLYQYSVTLSDLNKIAPMAQIINRAVKENLVIED